MWKHVLLLPLSFLLIAHAYAWNSRGHRVVVAIAYDELDADVRAALGEVLHAHPDFDKWSREYRDDDAPVRFDLYLLMRASGWPDEIRRGASQYGRPAWHYTNYPLVPPDFRFIERIRPDDDVIEGLRRSLDALRDQASTPEEHAVYLSWILHLVGDLHQPLHTVTWMGPEFEEGDRGGNEFFVRVDRRGYDLHELWDHLPGTDRRAQSAYRKARVLQFLAEENTDLRATTPDEDLETWALEARGVALEHVYLNGRLHGARSRGEATLVPDDYLRQARKAADRQLLRAGFRLARVLRSLEL